MFFGSLPDIRRSLAVRLTVWYAGIFTVSSFAAFLLFYLIITSVLQDQIDRELRKRYHGFSRIMVTGGLNTVKQVAVLEAQAFGEKKYFFRLLSRNGLVFSSSNTDYWQQIHVSNDAMRKMQEGSPVIFETITDPESFYRIRILYGVLGPGVILQIGQPMEGTTRFIDAFQRIFLTTMTLIFLLGSLIGWFMARRALSGVGVISRTASRISEGDLEQRVPLKGRGDEIDKLAATFNGMLDRIQQLVAGIREMTDNIAHDLKSPVTRIRGIAEVTLTTETGPEAYEKMAANTIEECDRLLDMINTMLMISRTEAGIGRLQKESFEIDRLVQDACALFQSLAEDKGIKMICRTECRQPIIGDIRLIQRMVANLLDNAIEYTPPEGRIQVSTERRPGRRVNLRIEDNGIGIAPEHLPLVFERFYRCDPSRSASGAGLGLSLARAVARAHGGDIVVSSTPGNGSTFTITLPLEAA